MIHLWFISKYLHWYNDGITRWLMRDLTCVQSSRVCHSVKPEAEPVSSLPQPCPQAGSPKRLLKSSREAKAALFSHATCPLPGPGRCDAYGRGTVTCSPRFCCCNFSSPTENCYGNLAAAQVLSFPIYSQTQMQTVAAPNTYLFKPLKTSDDRVCRETWSVQSERWPGKASFTCKFCIWNLARRW